MLAEKLHAGYKCRDIGKMVRKEILKGRKKDMEFKFELATKNTYGFQEKGTGDPAIGALYVQKSEFGSKKPKKVKEVGRIQTSERKRQERKKQVS